MKRARSSHQKSKPQGRLDLGLSSLLSSFEAIPAPPSQPISPVTNEISREPNFILVGHPAALNGSATAQAVKPAEPSKEAELTPYESLARESRWEDLSALCEERLAKKDRNSSEVLEGYEARLWWVRSQLACGGVPSSILAAPLDSVSEGMVKLHTSSGGALKERAPLLGFAAELLQEVAELLIKNKDHGLGISFLERAYRLGANNASTLLREIEADLQRISDDPRKNRLTKNQERVAKLGALKKELRTARVKVEKPEFEPGTNPSAESTELASKRASASLTWAAVLLAPRGSRRSFLALGTAGLLGALAVLYLPTAGSAILSSREAVVANSPFESDRHPEIMLPEVQRVASLSSLDALFYDIDASRARVDAQRVAAPGGTALPASGTSKVEVVPNAGPATIRQVVNTSGPLEGPEFAQIQAGEDDRTVRRSDELFGPVRSAIPSKVEGMEVDKYEADKLFIVITKTNVMARPSFQTAALAELQSGDKVLVEAKVGPWLKLRSKQGQAGYILAQDAELSKSGK